MLLFWPMSHELLIVTPDHKTRRVNLDTESLSLGRAHTNDLCYPEDASLSRRHLVLRSDEKGVWVEDLGSKNGTLVNGTRLTEPTLINPGDRLIVGHLEITLVDPDGGDTSVVFVPSTGPDIAPQGTVMTRLEDLLSNEATAPAFPASSPGMPIPSPTPALAPQPAFDTPIVKAMFRAGRELARDRPLEELFPMILEMSIEAVGAERGVLLALESGRLVSKAVHGDQFRISATIRDKVLNEKASLLIRDMAQEEAFREQLSISAQQIHTMMAVPLQTEQDVIGLIYVDSRMWMREFTSDDLNLLTFLGNIAAIKIEQQRFAVIQKDSEQAAVIQRRILPGGPPKVEGLDLAGYNVPCRTVGGDYYDYIVHDDGKISVVLADVAGKGISAAMLVSNLQARVQMLAEGDSPKDLGPLVSRLDSSLAAHCPNNRFITMFYSVVDPGTGELAYVNAGHNPPFLIRADGKIDKLPSDGTVLCILPELGYEQKPQSLGQDDLLAIYSDGLTEFENAEGEEYGEDRLAEFIASQRHLPAQEIIEATMDDIRTFSDGGEAADDVTLVIVRRVSETS